MGNVLGLWLLFFFLSLLVSASVNASWSQDPNVNVSVCTSSGGMGGHDGAVIEIVYDGDNGAIIGWSDISRQKSEKKE